MTTITLPRATVEQVLEALEDVDGPITLLLGSLLGKPDADAPGSNVRAAITALRAALAQEPQTTHSADCWRWHHACAVAMIERERLGRRDPLFVGRRSALDGDK